MVGKNLGRGLLNLRKPGRLRIEHLADTEIEAAIPTEQRTDMYGHSLTPRNFGVTSTTRRTPARTRSTGGGPKYQPKSSGVFKTAFAHVNGSRSTSSKTAEVISPPCLCADFCAARNRFASSPKPCK